MMQRGHISGPRGNGKLGTTPMNIPQQVQEPESSSTLDAMLSNISYIV